MKQKPKGAKRQEARVSLQGGVAGPEAKATRSASRRRVPRTRPARLWGAAMRTRLSVLSASGAIAALLVGAAVVAIGAEPVGDKDAGQTKAAVCAACHGPKGISVNPLWPSLAGQQEAYLAKQIKEFRDGVRVEATMQPFVANLTDQDVADLAAYYASLSPCP